METENNNLLLSDPEISADPVTTAEPVTTTVPETSTEPETTAEPDPTLEPDTSAVPLSSDESFLDTIEYIVSVDSNNTFSTSLNELPLSSVLLLLLVFLLSVSLVGGFKHE